MKFDIAGADGYSVDMGNGIKGVVKKVTVEIIYETLKEEFDRIHRRIDSHDKEFERLHESLRGLNTRIDQLYHLFGDFIKSQIDRRQ